MFTYPEEHPTALRPAVRGLRIACRWYLSVLAVFHEIGRPGII